MILSLILLGRRRDGKKVRSLFPSGIGGSVFPIRLLRSANNQQGLRANKSDHPS